MRPCRNLRRRRRNECCQKVLAQFSEEIMPFITFIIWIASYHYYRPVCTCKTGRVLFPDHDFERNPSNLIGEIYSQKVQTEIADCRPIQASFPHRQLPTFRPCTNLRFSVVLSSSNVIRRSHYDHQLWRRAAGLCSFVSQP